MSNMTNDEVGLVTWHNNFTIANGSAVLTDGAKRDRLIWPTTTSSLLRIP
jgi:hypothetical protein